MQDGKMLEITPVGTPVMSHSWNTLSHSIAPELIRKEAASNKVDVFSFGSVINEIFSGEINYEGIQINLEQVGVLLELNE